MRSYNVMSFHLVGATAAALLILKSPPPAYAQSEAQSAPTQAQTETPKAASPAPSAAAPASPDQAAAKPAAETAPGEAPKSAEADAAEPAKPKPLPTTLVARINLTSQTMTVTANGKPIHTWKVSSGAPGYATPPGTFKPGWMSKMWYSRQYDDAPMPHSVFFNGGIAVHGTTSIGNLGRAASHGCVRLAPGNAARFYSLVSKHGMAQTRIVVHGRQPFSDAQHRIAKMNAESRKRARSRTAARGGSNQWVMARNNSAWGDSYGYTPQRRVGRSRSGSAYWN